jgi:hypothetical protein
MGFIRNVSFYDEYGKSRRIKVQFFYDYAVVVVEIALKKGVLNFKNLRTKLDVHVYRVHQT